jgi:glycosyltransferase involved in cell wall biosynthesis
MENEFTNIGLVTFNRLEYTKQSIQSILKTTHSKWKLTVVDNGSTDGTVEYLQKLHKESYIDRLICLESNIGVAKASNIAWLLEPNAGFFVKIDNDIIIKKDCWLFDMITLIKANARLGLVGYNVEKKTYPLIENANATRLRKTDENIGGAVVLIPEKTRNLIGYWSEEYGLYGEEDADYSARVKAIGLEYAYMEDEDAMFHLPGGKAAEIDPKTFLSMESLENEDFPAYRTWKDQERQKNLVDGGLYIRNRIGYQNKWMPTFKPATYASVIVRAIDESVEDKNHCLVNTKIINNNAKREEYTIIFPLTFNEKEKIENSIRILLNTLEHSGNAPSNIVITCNSKVNESILKEILHDINVVFNYENHLATRDALILSAALVCDTKWIVVIDPYMMPALMWARDILYIANNYNWDVVGVFVTDSTERIDHVGFGINELEMKYEKLFTQMNLGTIGLNNLVAIPSPHFFVIKRTLLLATNNKKIINEEKLLDIFQYAVDAAVVGISKIPVMKLLDSELVSDDIKLSGEGIGKIYTLEKIYETFSLNLKNNNTLSQAFCNEVAISAMFENAKRLTNKGRVFHCEVILCNLSNIYSKSSNFWSLLGNFYFELGMFDKAIDAFLNVVNLGAKSKETYQNLGMAAYRSGAYLESTQYFDEAIKLVNGGEK